MNRAESMGLTKVLITANNGGFPVGFTAYWDKDQITKAKLNDGDVVWNGDMTEYWWQQPDDMDVIEGSEGAGNG